MQGQKLLMNGRIRSILVSGRVIGWALFLLFYPGWEECTGVVAATHRPKQEYTTLPIPESTTAVSGEERETLKT